MRGTLALLLIAVSALTGTLQAQSAELPAELRGWQDWVLHDREYLRCPYLGGADASVRVGRICVWPGPIEIDAGPAGARFAQQLRVYAPGFLPLPGDAQAWPQDVQVDGRAAPVIARDGRPQLRLEPGLYRVTGRLAWTEMPESIALSTSVSLVELRVGGKRIPLPERSGDNLRLGASRVETQADRLDLQVYRRLVDSVPGTLTTRVTLNVAGRPREVLLGPLLPEGFVPMKLEGPLPARLQPDGRLRVQARPGTWSIDLEARAASALASVQLPRSGIAEEVWSFEAVDSLRSASIEGASGIDPSQANVPDEWQALPAYRLVPGDTITITERSRGAGDMDRNELMVERNLWRDFDSGGYTFQDHVGGRMQQDWRLEMAPPWNLQGARLDEQSLLVTQREEGRAGVELRAPELGLEATGRLVGNGGRVAATGWDTRLASLGINLQLPPGHRLLAASGVDVASSAWLNRWRLLDVFAVLLVAAVAFRVAGVPAAVLALVAFTLTHHELPALTWAALNLLVAIALARAVPEGRIRAVVGTWRTLSVAAVFLMLVPFALSQARLAFFPQLEPTGGGGAAEMITVTAARRDAAAPLVEQEEDAAAAAREAARDYTFESKLESDSVSSNALPAPYLLSPSSIRDRYAPGTQLQNGPGVPQWNYQSHRLQMERSGRTRTADAPFHRHTLLARPVATGRHRARGPRDLRICPTGLAAHRPDRTRPLAQAHACRSGGSVRMHVAVAGGTGARPDALAAAAAGTAATPVRASQMRAGLRLDPAGTRRGFGRHARNPARSTCAGPRRAGAARGTAALAACAGTARRYSARRIGTRFRRRTFAGRA